jgi:hypothetical protein
MQLNTVREQDAYDKGWADAKDWWVPLEQDRILKLMEENFARFDLSNNMVDGMAFEEFARLVRDEK